MDMSNYRKTTQPLLPKIHEPGIPGEYDLYPSYPLGKGKIEQGFHNLASKLIEHSQIVIDGYVGVLWDDFRDRLDQALRDYGVQTRWISVDRILRPSDQIEMLI
jgi:hypothetical protein